MNLFLLKNIVVVRYDGISLKFLSLIGMQNQDLPKVNFLVRDLTAWWYEIVVIDIVWIEVSRLELSLLDFHIHTDFFIFIGNSHVLGY